MTTNVPVPTFGPTGFIIPSSAAVLAGIQADLNAAFGGNMNMSPATPQGQMAASIAAIVNNCYALFLQYSNLVDPALSFGRMQDGIGRIYFIQRNPAQSTIVQCTCTGLSGVTIPAGALAQDTAGNVYSCTTGGTIGAGVGTISLPFANLVPGPIPCASGTLTIIYRGIPGWDAITNPAAGVPGSNVETPAAFETRRANSVAKNSIGMTGSVLGSVLAIAGVIDAYVIDNSSNNPLTVGGVTINPNSLYVCVLGGTSALIAQAIWKKKGPGCSYNGNTTVTVLDQSANYVPPYPSYQVAYQTAIILPVVMQVTILNSSLVPSNVLQLVQTAVINAFAGLDGLPRAKIGVKLMASRYYSTIAALGPWAQIISILIGSPNNPSATFNASIAGTTMTVNSVASGTLAANQYLIDTTGNVVAGTTIVNQLTGPVGGVGTYTVSNSQTLASENMNGVIPNLYDFQVFISQSPSISAAMISVVLGTG